MKNKIFSLCIASAVLCFAGCSGPEPVREQSFAYVVELNISNESAAAKTVMAEAYILYDITPKNGMIANLCLFRRMIFANTSVPSQTLYARRLTFRTFLK